MINIRISTDLGDILAELYDDKAVRTTTHFMSYVDEGYYSGACFYRSARSADNELPRDIRIDVIEGGYYNAYYGNALMNAGKEDEPPFDDALSHIGAKPQIMLETTKDTGVRHIDGALSMGRSAPDTVDDAFFICVGEQKELDFGGKRHPDGLGFPAFGRVTKGMDIVRRIHASETTGQKLARDVMIYSIERI